MEPAANTSEREPATLPRCRRLVAEMGGACGDLGTFIPHVIGAITVAGLAPAGVLIGFGAFFIASGAFYGLPMAVQPMKAISAVLVTGQVGAAEVAAAGHRETAARTTARVRIDRFKGGHAAAFDRRTQPYGRPVPSPLAGSPAGS